MGLVDRARAWLEGREARPAVVDAFPDLPLQLPDVEDVQVEEIDITPSAMERRMSATVDAASRKLESIRATTRREGIQMPFGAIGVDPDENTYRRLTGGANSGNKQRDLGSIAQDKMLEVGWYLWEQNPFARRLIELETDLILGEGVTVTAKDPRIAAELKKTWEHPSNLLDRQIRSFYNFLALTGELALPCVVNPVTGRPTMGFIDPWDIKKVYSVPGNALIPDIVQLKPDGGIGEGEKLKVIRINPETDRLEGDLFYFRINALPNSMRGRSDLLPLADWLDLYDQYMFAEVERISLLSNFVWDLTVKDADDKAITQKLKDFPSRPKPGTVYAHNDKETLEAVSPALNVGDKSEVAHMLRIHIAGAKGFPASYFGETDSNRATIEGQNDVMMKTPAARQKEFGAMIDLIVRYTIQETTTKNPALFRDADSEYIVRMPEIASKDVARVGTVLAAVAQAMDTAKTAGFVPARIGTLAICAVLQHLGVDEDPVKVLEEAAKEKEEAQAQADEIQAGMAAAAAAAGGGQPAARPAPGPGGRGNPPIPNRAAAAV